MNMRKSVSFGLFLALSASASAQTAVVPVELSNFKFTPNIIQLRAGEPVTLHLQNASGGGHNFSAPEFFAAARLDARSAALVRNGTVEIPGSDAVNITLVPAAGSYRVKCSHTLHSAFGMKGTIAVR
jgi:plastocyanin